MSFKIHRDLASLWMNSKLLLQFASNRCPRSVFDQGLRAICDTVWTIFLWYLTPIISQPREVYYGYTCILGSHDTMKGVLQIFGLGEIFGSASYWDSPIYQLPFWPHTLDKDCRVRLMTQWFFSWFCPTLVCYRKSVQRYRLCI